MKVLVTSLVLLWYSSKMVGTSGLELVFVSVKRNLLKWQDVSSSLKTKRKSFK